ncbi:hypothetical protein GCM10027258_57940 [Amycolatopsis stemonae]
MDALAYAVAMAAANAAATTPPGGADLAHYQGEILSWDESTGLNSVKVNGSAVSNMRVLQSGIGVTYQPGDTVMVEKRMSQWYILGKVAAPGAGAANRIQSQTIAANESTGSASYTDLATFGPSVSVYIGSSRRCLVLVSAFITMSGTTASTASFIGGTASVTVSGASTIGHNLAYASASLQTLVPFGRSTFGAGGSFSASGTRLFTAADGLAQGVNTFTVQYLSLQTSPTCGFRQRTLTVIPF